jgi:histidyl-tRNA synthetase
LKFQTNAQLNIDLTLARGLNYYTGTIFEVKAKDVQIGSIGGGGRYDDLTGLFGVPNLPGVGISFGVDRIYDVMDELGIFPAAVQAGTRVLFFNLGEAEAKSSYELMQQLRNRNISSEIYHEQAKFDKQFKYAERKKIPYIIIIGGNELQAHTCTIKDLQTGQQQTIAQDKIASVNFS